MWRVALVVLCGCDQLFGIAHFDHGGAVDAADDVRRDAPAFTCPPDYIQDELTHGYYKPISTPLLFLGAEIRCEMDRGSATGYTHLLVVNSPSELEELANDGYLVGLSARKQEGVYIWITDESAPVDGTLWATNEPNNQTFEKCVDYNQTALLTTTDCGINHPAMCECDAYAPDLSRF